MWRRLDRDPGRMSQFIFVIRKHFRRVREWNGEQAEVDLEGACGGFSGFVGVTIATSTAVTTTTATTAAHSHLNLFTHSQKMALHFVKHNMACPVSRCRIRDERRKLTDVYALTVSK